MKSILFPICLICLISLIPCSRAVQAQTTTPAGVPVVSRVEIPADTALAPDFFWTGSDGREHSLREYRGRIVMLMFWATYCPVCQRTLPSMIDLRGQYSEDDVVILGMAVNRQSSDSAMTLRQYVGWYAAGHGINYPVVISNDMLNEVYHISYTPTFVIVDSYGRITERLTGKRGEPFLKIAIARARH